MPIIGIQHLQCWVLPSIIVTTGVTVAIGIQHLRCWCCLNRRNHRRNCGYWNSTPPVLVSAINHCTTGVTVAIGIQHLRCRVRKPKVFNSNSHGHVHGLRRDKIPTLKGLNKKALEIFIVSNAILFNGFTVAS
jgi:hypothetical protein